MMFLAKFREYLMDEKMHRIIISRINRLARITTKHLITLQHRHGRRVSRDFQAMVYSKIVCKECYHEIKPGEIVISSQGATYRNYFHKACAQAKNMVV